MTRKQKLAAAFTGMLGKAHSALRLKYGRKDGDYIIRAFQHDPAEIIALAARDLLRKP